MSLELQTQMVEYGRQMLDAAPPIEETELSTILASYETLESGHVQKLAPKPAVRRGVFTLVTVVVVLVFIGFNLSLVPGDLPAASDPRTSTVAPPGTTDVPPTSASTPSTAAASPEVDALPILPPLGEAGVWHEVGRYELVDGEVGADFERVAFAQQTVIDGRTYMVSWTRDGLWVSNDGVSWEKGPEVSLAGEVGMVVSRSGLFFENDANVVFLDNGWVEGDPVPLTWEVPNVDLSLSPSSFTFEVFSGPMAMIDGTPILLMWVEADIDLGVLLGHPGTRTEEIYDGEEITRVFELVADDGAVRGRFRWEVDESGFDFFDDATENHLAHLPIAEGGNWDGGPYGDGIERIFASGQERTVVVRLDTGDVIFDEPGGFQYFLEVPDGVLVGKGSDDSIETLFTDDAQTWEQITIPGPPEYVPALGIYEISSQDSLWTSSDGLEWTRQPAVEVPSDGSLAHRPIRLVSGWVRIVGGAFELTAFEYSKNGETWTRLELPAGTVDRTWGWGYTIGDRVVMRQFLPGESDSGAFTVWAVDIDFNK